MRIPDFSSAGEAAAHTDRMGSGDPEADSSVLNVEDFSNNADQVSGLGRPTDRALLQNLNSEEGADDDYESDFEVANEPGSSQVTPNSATSPFIDKRRVKSRSNAQSNSAFSPKLYNSQ